MMIHGEYGRIIKTGGSNNRKLVMSFDGEIVKHSKTSTLVLISYLLMILNGELMIIYSGIDQQTYGTMWRNYSWLMSRSGGPLLSATFEIMMILHLGILGMGSSSTTKTSPRRL